MSDTDSKFRLNCSNTLGFSFEQYISQVRGVAIKSPEQYFKERALVLKKIKAESVEKVYTIIFNALSQGKGLDGQPLGTFLGQNSTYTPSYPEQSINDCAITIAASLATSLNDIVDIILPSDFDKIASSKLAVKAGASSIDEIVDRATNGTAV